MTIDETIKELNDLIGAVFNAESLNDTERFKICFILSKKRDHIVAEKEKACGKSKASV